MNHSELDLQFFDFVDILLLQLSTADNVQTLDLLSLMASETHRISLFSERLLSLFSDCNSYLLLKAILLPFMTWLDHSILKKLVSASNCTWAMDMLNQFDSSIDYSQPITSYPIPSPSQLMIPLDGSDYTLVATKCNSNFEEKTLQIIVDIRDLLTKKWEITTHAIQLVGIHIKYGVLYWMIPRSVVSLIEENLVHVQYELWKNGIAMTSIFPSSPFMVENDMMFMKSSPFSLLISKVST